MEKSILDNYVVVIPCLEPDDNLLETIKSLKEEGFYNIVIVNDGSSPRYDIFFTSATEIEGINCVILVHDHNMGQGRAYKTAFDYFLHHFSGAKGVIQCDADGQHKACDVRRCAEYMEEYPDELILGERDFNGGSVPFKSRFGNKCTSLVFHIFFHLDIKDTQTGLKGIPSSLVSYLIDAPGERYEFCSCTLLEANRLKYGINSFPIQTVYDNKNSSSHFKPVRDAIRVYGCLLKYYLSL